MSDLNIVLIEPEIPQNTGNIARTCAAVGAALHLVEPMGFKVDDAKLKRAGLDYWHSLDITYYPNLDEFLRVNEGEEMFFFSTKAKNCYSDVTYPKKLFLVFGKETRGLPESLLERNLDRCVRLPMRESLRSLNLSNTAAVAVYEVLRQRGFAGLCTEGHLTGRAD